VVASLVCAAAMATPTAAHANNERFTAFRVGADLGYARIATENYAQLNATGLLRLGPARLDFYVPLRFRLTDFALRQEDWADARDYLRTVRCARVDIGDYVRPQDQYDPSCEAYEGTGGLHDRWYFSARFAPLRALDLGHETLVTGFNNSLDPNRPQVGGIINAIFRDWGYAHFFTDDISNPQVLAANAALRPMQILGQNWDETPDDLELAASVVSDINAPVRVRGAFGRPLRDGDGNLQTRNASLTALSAHAHYWRLFDACTEQGSAGCTAMRRMGFFAFADYNRFVGVDDGDALHTGARFWYRTRGMYSRYDGRALDRARGFDVFKVSIGAEYRFMGNRYLPGYFDGNYSVQREQFALNDQARSALGTDALTVTKLEFLLQQPAGRSHAFSAYAQVVIPVPTAEGEPPSPLPITLWIEDGGGPLRTSASATVGPFRLDQVSIGAQILRRNFDGLENLFSLDGSLIRVVGSVFLSSAQRRRSPQASILDNLMVNFSWNRRFLRNESGALDTTNDLFISLGTSAGL
jgi:hypothetical protein